VQGSEFRVQGLYVGGQPSGLLVPPVLRLAGRGRAPEHGVLVTLRCRSACQALDLKHASPHYRVTSLIRGTSLTIICYMGTSPMIICYRGTSTMIVCHRRTSPMSNCYRGTSPMTICYGGTSPMIICFAPENGVLVALGGEVDAKVLRGQDVHHLLVPPAPRHLRDKEQFIFVCEYTWAESSFISILPILGRHLRMLV
jgi:hypothetical protein